LVYAEKLRAGVSAIELEVGDGIKAKVTISVGLATYPKDAKDADSLQAAADSALYGAKALGRNCVVLYENAQKPESV
jgi:two-component system cell cycle response regulator